MLPRSRWPGAAALLGTTLAVALLAADRDPARAGGDKKATITLTEKDNDTKVKAAKGDTLVVKLPMTAGTGFTWVLARYDKEKIETDGKAKTEVPDKDKKVVGGPLTMVYTFTAKAAGTAELELQYKRPFEKDKPAAKTFKVTVLID